MTSSIQKTTPMMAQWARCKSQAHGALVFFRLGDFYEAFHEDAEIIAKTLELTLTKRQEVPMCGVPWHSSETYIDKLIQKGFSVAIAEQIQESIGDNNSKGIMERKIVQILSPGTSTSSSILQEHGFHFIGAITESGPDRIGMALIDMSTGLFITLESENEEEKKRLIQELLKRRPKEILFSKSCIKNQEALVKEIETSLSIRKTVVENWMFDTNLAYETLQNHFKIHSLESFGLFGKDEAVRASSALITFIRDTLFHNVSHLKKIQYIETASSMHLDMSTLKNLDIFEVDSKKSDAKGLFHVLNQTKTPMGSRLLRLWLLQPLINKAMIEKRQDKIEEYLLWISSETNGQSLRFFEALSSIRDLERVSYKIGSLAVLPRDVRFLASCLQAVEKMRKELVSSINIPKGILQDINEIPPLQEIARRIEMTIIDEPPVRITDGETIKRGVDQELDELKDIKLSADQWLISYQNRLKEEFGIKTLKVGFTRAFGYYIEVSRGQADKIPASFSRRQTLTTGERFISEELMEFEKKVLSAEARIQAREAVLFQNLVTEIRLFQEVMQSAAEKIAMIDLISSLAMIAIERKYIRPKIVEESILDIKQGRHPVAEILLDTPYVSNDIVIGQKNRSFQLITGPNMGGKSTYIRSAALIVIMAHIGSFIPAASGTIGIVDRVMSRVGASDDLASGQSTFMVEMTETAHIMHTATNRSLILLDEIGRGTSTFDGISIAWAITEFLTSGDRLTPRTLFTTHYHELTALEKTLPRLMNMTVLVSESQGKIRCVYKVVPGKADKSYGIHVAELAGIPEKIICRSKEILHELEQGSRTPQIKENNITQRDSDQEHAKKALLFIRSLDFTRLTPMECFMKLHRIHEEIQKEIRMESPV